MDEYESLSHSKWECKYHVVFIPKGRRRALYGQLRQHLGEFPVGREIQKRLGHHTALSVPLMREDRAIGAIALWRMEARRFTDEQIALVKTFANQAAIAIENVRLFNETKEALEQQTATSEILRMISQSPMSVQPVFDTIVGATLRLCSGRSANLFTFDGQLLHLAAHARPTGGRNDAVAVDSLAMQRNFPRPPGRDLAAPRAVLTCSVVSIPDVLADAEYTFKEAALAGGFRSVLAVPLIREGSPIGAIVVGRPEPGPFPETQIALLKTFADQAVIAIENVRLFNETRGRRADSRPAGTRHRRLHFAPSGDEPRQRPGYRLGRHIARSHPTRATRTLSSHECEFDDGRVDARSRDQHVRDRQLTRRAAAGAVHLPGGTPVCEQPEIARSNPGAARLQGSLRSHRSPTTWLC